VGSGVGSDLGGQTRVDTFVVEIDTSFIPSTISTGASPHLYVGCAKGIHAESLIRFYRPDRPFVWTIDSACIEMFYQGDIGDGSGISINWHVLDLSWGEADPPEWGFHTQPGEPELPPISIENDSGEVQFQVSVEWIRDWFEWKYSSEIDSTWEDTTRADSALTLYVVTADAFDKLIRFRSRSATDDSLRPKLHVFVTAKDSGETEVYQDTLIVTASGDLFLVKNDSTDIGTNLVIGSGAVYQTNLRFDVSPMWQLVDSLHVIVNRAVVDLHKIPSAYPGLSLTRSIWPFRLSDEDGFTNPDSAAESGFALYATAIDTSLDSTRIVVTGAASKWIKGVDHNYGLALHSGTEGLDIDRIAFYSMEAENPVMRPKLIIYYTEIVK